MSQLLKLRIVMLSIALVTFTSSCSLTKSKATAETAVGRFHDRFNAGQFHEIYSQSDPELKKVATEEDFVALLDAVHRKLGTVKETHSSGWGVNATPMGTMANLSYDVEFSDGKGSEQFVFHVSGDKATLAGYHVNSPLLITR